VLFSSSSFVWCLGNSLCKSICSFQHLHNNIIVILAAQDLFLQTQLYNIIAFISIGVFIFTRWFFTLFSTCNPLFSFILSLKPSSNNYIFSKQSLQHAMSQIAKLSISHTLLPLKVHLVHFAGVMLSMFSVGFIVWQFLYSPYASF